MTDAVTDANDATGGGAADAADASDAGASVASAPSLRDFAGKVALVTGGASGIGRASAELFAARGASVVVADRDIDGGAAVVEAIVDAGGAAIFQAVDVSDPEQINAMVSAATDAYGRLDCALNNAGMPGTYAPLDQQVLEEWQRVLAVNLTSVFLSMQAEIPAMLASGGGSIVNTASAAGLIGFAHLPAYVASKHGVVGLTKAVALEYAAQGVRVNAICPGTIRTPMLEGFAGDEKSLVGMGRITPIARLGTPDEVAQAAVWLCSDAASFVIGHALSVDGGVIAT